MSSGLWVLATLTTADAAAAEEMQAVTAVAEDVQKFIRRTAITSKATLVAVTRRRVARLSPYILPQHLRLLLKPLKSLPQLAAITYVGSKPLLNHSPQLCAILCTQIRSLHQQGDCSNQASLSLQPVAEAVSNIQLLITAAICDRGSSRMRIDAAQTPCDASTKLERNVHG